MCPARVLRSRKKAIFSESSAALWVHVCVKGSEMSIFFPFFCDMLDARLRMTCFSSLPQGGYMERGNGTGAGTEKQEFERELADFFFRAEGDEIHLVPIVG
eukprot:GFKZ01000298.1.p8 GENE.GFKZ01000298.1~~GFKZ01000298.1.p8  ORF type:complete len:101 (-),score=11.73 GFKZ01000298.1:4353-4655(-)